MLVSSLPAVHPKVHIFYPFNYIALWSNNLLDTDKIMESFYSECADAGPDHCAFWAPSPDDIRQNLTNLYDSIRFHPVPTKSGNTYGYVDYKMLHSLVFSSLYFPYKTFPRLAQGLAELAAGNGTTVFEMAQMKTSPPFECSGDPPKVHQEESQAAILCNDGVDIPADLHSTQKYFKMMSKISAFGTHWASIRTDCV